MKIKWITYGLILLIGVLFGYVITSVILNNQERIDTEATELEIWTCSMHPEVSAGKDDKCPLCAMDLIKKNPDVKSAMSSKEFLVLSDDDLLRSNITTTRVIKTDKDSWLELSIDGIITTNKNTDAIQTTLFNGRIDKLLKKTIGEKLYKNTVIGTVYSPELYLAQDKLLTSVSYKDSHQKLFAAARNSLGLWKMTDGQIEEMLASKEPVKYFPMYADVSGTIIDVLVKEGVFYKEGDPLFKVSDLRSVWIEFDVYGEDMVYVKTGDTINIAIKELPYSKIQGQISFVNPILNNNGALGVRVEVQNKDEALKPGMLATGLLKTKLPAEKIVIPITSVLWTGNNSIVYVKTEEANSFRMRQVKLGSSYKDYIEVVSGLEPGELIVTKGAFTIDAAAQFKGVNSMLNQPETRAKEIKDTNTLFQEYSLHTQNDSLLAHYLALKNAFVASSLTEVKERAVVLSDKLMRMETNDLIRKNCLGYLDGVIKAEDIEAQRRLFKDLSKAFITHFKREKFNLADTPVYIQHCDCALENTGGDWLSTEKTIYNPYFGDAMLHCGRVVETIP